MLPDYPKIKKRILNWFKAQMQSSQAQSSRLINELRTTIVHEGDNACIYREDGTIGHSPLGSPIEAKATLQFDQQAAPPLLTLDDYRKLAKKLAHEMADAKSQVLFRTMDEVVTEHGQVIESKGDAVEQVFAAYERVQLDFNEDGSPRRLHMVFGDEDTANKIRSAQEKIENTPALRQRMVALQKKKWQEWRDREIARNLVD